MAVNRYYRSSAPRYTSQFVEERYPEDLILQSGAMKYAQKQQFAKDVGEFSALNNMLEPGYRTQQIAPEVKEKYNTRLNEFISKYQTNYDSPQALMELSQLRYSWLGDPDVQLIKQDRETGNKEYDDIRRSTKTYSMDYDPNVNPQTKTVKQFRPKEPYKPYDPLVNFEDTDIYANNLFNRVRGDVRSINKRGFQKNPVTGLPEEVNITSQVEYRDMNKLQPVVESLVAGVLNNTMPGASYLKTKFRDQNGNLREPDVDELRSYFTDLAKQAQYSEVRTSDSYRDISGSSGTQGSGGIGTFPIKLEASPKQTVYDNLTKNTVKGDFLKGFFNRNIKFGEGRSALNVDNNDYAQNVIERLKNEKVITKNSSNKEIKKAILSDIDNRTKAKRDIKIDRVDPDTDVLYSEMIGGKTAKTGIMSGTSPASVLRGQPLFDYDTGQFVEKLDDKSSILKEKNVINILGEVSADELDKSPLPGMIAFEVQDGKESKRYMIQLPGLKQKDKLSWNLNGFKRDNVSEVGDPFAVEFYQSDDGTQFENITDLSEPQYEFNEKKINVNTPNSLYLLPMRDNTDGGKIKVKVYAFNPLYGQEEDQMNANLFNNENNELFINEYNLSDFNGSMMKLYEQIRKDAPENLIKKQSQ